MVDIHKYGPWAVIAGGSEGVGAEFAKQLAEQGMNLVLLARKEAPLQATADACRGHGVEVRTLSVDLLAADALDRIEQITDDLLVGLFIYNAGANTYGHEFVTGDLDRFQAVIDLNITAQLKLVQYFGAAMRERRRGGILLVGSLSGYLGSAQISIYSAVKSFLRTFAEGLWLEMRDHDVDVLELVLGLTRTPAMDRAGLKMDTPGQLISEPRDVAAHGLANLANGPVVVVKEFAEEQRAQPGRVDAGGSSGREEAASAPVRVTIALKSLVAFGKRVCVLLTGPSGCRRGMCPLGGIAAAAPRIATTAPLRGCARVDTGEKHPQTAQQYSLDLREFAGMAGVDPVDIGLPHGLHHQLRRQLTQEWILA